jgi:CDP-diacylglycerol--serine O-phosphatidyltransferase
MVTRLPLLSLKFKNLKFKGNEGRFIIIGLVLISFIIFGFAAAPLIIPIYLIVSLITPPTPQRGALYASGKQGNT